MQYVSGERDDHLHFISKTIFFCLFVFLKSMLLMDAVCNETISSKTCILKRARIRVDVFLTDFTVDVSHQSRSFFFSVLNISVLLLYALFAPLIYFTFLRKSFRYSKLYVIFILWKRDVSSDYLKLWF